MGQTVTKQSIKKTVKTMLVLENGDNFYVSRHASNSKNESRVWQAWSMLQSMYHTGT